jgi:hypothetical protein
MDAAKKANIPTVVVIFFSFWKGFVVRLHHPDQSLRSFEGSDMWQLNSEESVSNPGE